jgi:RES domain
LSSEENDIAISAITVDYVNRILLPIFVLKKSVDLYRIHKTRRDPINFVTNEIARYRFNDPSGGYGVLYAALDSFAAFCETARPSGLNMVSHEFIDTKCLSVLKSKEDLKLVDVSGSGLARISSDARQMTSTARDYHLCQSWSRIFYDHKDKVDGIYYRSRRDPSRFCVALFDLVKNCIEEDGARQRIDFRVMNNPTLRQIRDEYGYKFRR